MAVGATVYYFMVVRPITDADLGAPISAPKASSSLLM
jgi:hypothetical protein